MSLWPGRKVRMARNRAASAEGKGRPLSSFQPAGPGGKGRTKRPSKTSKGKDDSLKLSISDTIDCQKEQEIKLETKKKEKVRTSVNAREK